MCLYKGGSYVLIIFNCIFGNGTKLLGVTKHVFQFSKDIIQYVLNSVDRIYRSGKTFHKYL